MPKTAKSTAADRIEMLRRIIETPCTDPKCTASGTCAHQGEKDAARAHLARIHANMKRHKATSTTTAAAPGAFGSKEYADAWALIRERGYDDHGNQWWEGTKHRRLTNAGRVEWAKAIREDIKMARRAARFPLLAQSAGDKAVSIQAVDLFRFDPIGQAPAEIKFTVRTTRGSGIDVTATNVPPAWGWTEEEADNGRGGTYTRLRKTPELKELGRELRRLANAYNASYGSNIETDISAYAFLLSVLVEDPRGHHTLI